MIKRLASVWLLGPTDVQVSCGRHRTEAFQVMWLADSATSVRLSDATSGHDD